MQRIGSTLALTLGTCLLLGGASPAQQTIHVSPRGDDAGQGSAADPLATPSAAIERARAIEGPVVVELAEGEYHLASTLVLGAEDSGLTLRAAAGSEVRLSGGRRVGRWSVVDDPHLLQRLPEEARGHVLATDLAELGVAEYGSPEGGGLEVFYRDQPMEISRWPNEGFVRIAGVLGEDPVDVRGTVGDKVGKLVYEGDRPERWVGEPDPWLHGYWFWDWSDERQAIASIDIEAKVIELAQPYHGYGYREGQWYYAYNLLPEIDRPGEWYLDRSGGVLYFWPPGDLGDGDVMVSVLDTLIRIEDASDVRIEGLILEGARATAMSLESCSGCAVSKCVVRNGGGWAVRVAGGDDVGVTGCHIHGVGKGGIALSGGDRATLTAAGHYAEDNDIHHYGRWNRMYQAGISLSGVGLRAARNHIHDAPHMAIGFSGNDHLMELNEIHHVCEESNDAGAIYSGRDWTMRGTVIRHNFFHDITGFEDRGCVGVYLDDMFCGTEIVGNLFVRVTRAAMIGGGRDNSITGNIFVDCRPALHVDARAMGWASYHVDTTMTDRLNAMPYQSELWAERYPDLVDILDDDPAAPKGNLIARNIIIGDGWDGIYDQAEPFVEMTDNLVNVEGVLADPEGGDYRLAEDSPAREIRFEPIPYERIGPRTEP
jgi:hypothetical protein